MTIEDYNFCIILLFSVYLCFIITVWCGCDMHFSDLKDVSPQSHDAVHCIYENKLSSCYLKLAQRLECFLGKFIRNVSFPENHFVVVFWRFFCGFIIIIIISIRKYWL